MKLTPRTLSILENFANINQNLFVTAGSTIKTMSVAKNIFVSAEVDETFNQEFGIYNLKELLGVLSLFESPDIEFGEKSLTIKQGNQRVTYYYAQREVLVVPAKDIKMPEPDFEFDLSQETIAGIRKAASVLGVTDLSIVGNGTTISAVVGDVKNATSNAFSVDVGTTDKTFKANFKVENLKMIGADYRVKISSRGLACFESTSNKDYVMFVALEQNSTFN